MKTSLIVLLGLVLCSCAMPSTTVRTTDTRPSLAFEGAPEGAKVYLDGLLMGEAEKYDGQPGILVVEPGTHLIVVKGRDGSVLLEQKVYMESEIKTIKVH
ncbi:MAG: hypothetical protein A2W33_06415 [Chloroflexi bacterium RBG_16_52_11]|nr:MAG: hypothetical protein A2W33_06415 [Chloroflexi bacterium RBG_16_52_11]